MEVKVHLKFLKWINNVRGSRMVDKDNEGVSHEKNLLCLYRDLLVFLF